jgi:DNA-binding MarR family transcriptional regulator
MVIQFDRPGRLTQAPSPEQQEDLRAAATREQFQRGLRRRFFDPHVFGEPAWDILLALYVIDNVERRLSIAQLTTIAHVPLTTGLRWLTYLEEQDLVSRAVAPSDQRMVLIELTDTGRRAMEGYLTSVRDPTVSEQRPSGN